MHMQKLILGVIAVMFTHSIRAQTPPSFTAGGDSIHRMPYDSALIRPLAGTYRISRDREIAMGPFDEANGWLSFFDTKTRRGGILCLCTSCSVGSTGQF
jgi:hypothetical protein